MKNVLIMCSSDPGTDPRPSRMIQWLKKENQVTALGRAKVFMAGVDSVSLTDSMIGDPGTANEVAAGQGSSGTAATPGRRHWRDRLRTLRWWLLHIFRLIARRFEPIVEEMYGIQDTLVEDLAEEHFDLIITHDCSLLPIAFKIGNERSKIMLDAREYYPRNFDDRLAWRILFKPVNVHMCKEYLARCDKIITVSDGIAREYAREFGVQPEVITSLAEYYDLSPSKADPDAIRIIYHGHAGQSRRTEVMVELMDFMDERYSLDLMLTRPSAPYVQRLMGLAEERDNVRVIPPVPMQEIIPFTNQYDIGLFLCPPTNFNLKYTLPNKLFEFIQARLLVAIGPGIEMRKIVKQYDCGIVSCDFTPRSMAAELNMLDAERIMYHKEQSHRAAQELRADLNAARVNEIVGDLLSSQALN